MRDCTAFAVSSSPPSAFRLMHHEAYQCRSAWKPVYFGPRIGSPSSSRLPVSTVTPAATFRDKPISAAVGLRSASERKLLPVGPARCQRGGEGVKLQDLLPVDRACFLCASCDEGSEGCLAVSY